MGACASRESMRGDSAKLVLLDGTLQEFSSPVNVWQILQKNPTSFVCNSDEMDFDDTVSAVSGNEELRLGQLYFVLPLTWLSHPLRAEEMAALAVKASSALTKSGGLSCDDSIWERNYQPKKIARASEDKRWWWKRLWQREEEIYGEFEHHRRVGST